MSLASRNADAFTRVGEEIKLLRSQLSTGGGPWSYDEALDFVQENLVVIQNMIDASQTSVDPEQVNTLVDQKFAAKIKVVTNFPQSSAMVPGVLYLRT